MTEEKDDYVDDDLEERRRRWEGIHNDEAAQSRLPFDNTSQKEQEGSNTSLMEWVFGSLGCLGGNGRLMLRALQVNPDFVLMNSIWRYEP